MKMKSGETDKTRMLKGFQSVAVWGVLLSPMLKQLVLNPFQERAAKPQQQSLTQLKCNNPVKQTPRSPLKPQVLIGMSGWCCVSQPVSVHSQKSWPSGSAHPTSRGKPQDSKQSCCCCCCCCCGCCWSKRPVQPDNKSTCERKMVKTTVANVAAVPEKSYEAFCYSGSSAETRA